MIVHKSRIYIRIIRFQTDCARGCSVLLGIKSHNGGVNNNHLLYGYNIYIYYNVSLTRPTLNPVQYNWNAINFGMRARTGRNEIKNNSFIFRYFLYVRVAPITATPSADIVVYYTYEYNYYYDISCNDVPVRLMLT